MSTKSATVVLTVVLVIAITLITVTAVLDNINDIKEPVPIQVSEDNYNGEFKFVYGEPETVYGMKTYIVYDVESEVCYHKEYSYFGERYYNTIVELYYKDRLLHYCPHTITEDKPIGTFYILVNGSPLEVDPSKVRCPYGG